MSQNISLLSLIVIATAALEANRFASLSGAYPTAKGPAFGVTRSSAAVGASVSVDVLGSAVVTASAAIAKGAYIQVAANGKAVTQTDGAAVGIALEAASADGATFEALLIPSAPVGF